MTREHAAAYLGGIIDGEGCMKWTGGGKSIYRTLIVTVTNTDWDVLDATMDCCDVLDLRYRIEEVARSNMKKGWSPAWCVTISGRDSLQVISDEVPFRSTRKRARLDERLATYQRHRRDRDQRVEVRLAAARFRALAEASSK